MSWYLEMILFGSAGFVAGCAFTFVTWNYGYDQAARDRGATK